MARLALLVAVAAIVFPAATEAAAPPIQHFPQKTTLGFYRGKSVEYLDFGPLKLARGNRVEPIWVVTNGPREQVNIIDTVPGRSDYSPLWGVRMVTWKAGVTPRLLTSASAVRAAVARGEATVKRTGIVVNCPVV
jgi:hypothetical protein